MTPLLALALALYGVQALPHHPVKRGLDDPGCVASIPPNPDPNTVNEIYLAGVAQSVSLLVMQATFETCMQETRCNNLNCGDQDSLGAFQQRPSMGWGSPEQITNVTYSANAFLAQAIPLAAASPNVAPDVIAQGVQRAELGNLYAQHFDTANQLIQQAADATGVAWNGINPSGGGGGGNNNPPPPPPPPPSGGGQGGGCESYTAAPGDYCFLIAQNRGIDVGAFISWNPSINSDCTNLQVGTSYCVTAP
jgi:hypothetical protein